MATQEPTQEEVFASIVSSVAAGADGEGTQLEESAVQALNQRYFNWIVTPGKDKQGKPVEPTPQQVWTGTDGGMLRKKFEKIGKQAGKKAKDKGKTKVDGKETTEESIAVESDSDCPWCRPPV